MDNNLSLIHLLHISSASFPIGGFAHSFGMESLIEHQIIRNTDECAEYVKTVLNNSLGKIDAPVIAAAIKGWDNLTEINSLDELYGAMKVTRELRHASIKLGLSFLRMITEMYPSDTLKEYHKLCRQKENLGHYAVMYGMTCGYLGIEAISAITAYLESSVYMYIQTGIKLIPISQTDGQTILTSLYLAILNWAKQAPDIKVRDIAAFAPTLDIASMQHEILYSRLYIS